MLKRKTSICVILLMALLALGRAQPAFADGCGQAAPAPAGQACSMQLCLQFSASILPQALTVTAPSPLAEPLAFLGESVLPFRLVHDLFRPPRSTTFRG